MACSPTSRKRRQPAPRTSDRGSGASTPVRRQRHEAEAPSSTSGVHMVAEDVRPDSGGEPVCAWTAPPVSKMCPPVRPRWHYAGQDANSSPDAFTRDCRALAARAGVLHEVTHGAD